MSGSADVEDDATMTRDAGASRTFRSIFGDSASQDGQQDELKLQRFSRHGSGGALIGDSNGYRDNGGGGDDDDDDDDEGVWSDDAAPPKERGNSDGDDCEICLEDDDDTNNGDERIVDDSAADEQEDANAGFNSDASAPRAEELKIPHRRSMEEWADDDDEEDTWKDMLQAKVNQLELVIQSNNEATAPSSSSSSSQIAPAQATAALSTQLELAHHVESRIALAAATHTVSLRGTADRPANRNKIQRTSGTQSHVSGDHNHHRQVAGGGAPAVSSPSNYLRKRSGSRDFASSRTSRSTDAKKSAKVTSGSGRRESMTRSSSASSISSTHSRSSHAAQRKNSLDACSIGNHSRNNGALDALGGSTSSKATVKAPEPIRHISDAEAVRRFILHDIKQMSMDRIVADTKRLRFLEDFYQRKHAEDQERASAAESAAHGDNREDNDDDGDATMVSAETPLATD